MGNEMTPDQFSQLLEAVHKIQFGIAFIAIMSIGIFLAVASRK